MSLKTLIFFSALHVVEQLAITNSEHEKIAVEELSNIVEVCKSDRLKSTIERFLTLNLADHEEPENLEVTGRVVESVKLTLILGFFLTLSCFFFCYFKRHARFLQLQNLRLPTTWFRYGS